MTTYLRCSKLSGSTMVSSVVQIQRSSLSIYEVIVSGSAQYPAETSRHSASTTFCVDLPGHVSFLSEMFSLSLQIRYHVSSPVFTRTLKTVRVSVHRAISAEACLSRTSTLSYLQENVPGCCHPTHAHGHHAC